jgi:hypothetical protein
MLGRIRDLVTPLVVPLSGRRMAGALPVRDVRNAETASTLIRLLFICYRREDTQDAAGRLYAHFNQPYQLERAFMDIDTVPHGVDFVEHVMAQIARCSAVIVLIGKRWLKMKDKKRRSRLDRPDDLVRAEIRAALQQNIPVIPVLVQGASMPDSEDLPDDIKPLARRNGIELRHTRWNADVERLLSALRDVTSARPGVPTISPHITMFYREDDPKCYQPGGRVVDAQGTVYVETVYRVGVARLPGGDQMRGCRVILDAIEPQSDDPGMHRLGLALKPQLADAHNSAEFTLNPDTTAYVEVLREIYPNAAKKSSRIQFVYANYSLGAATWLTRGDYSVTVKFEGPPRTVAFRLSVSYDTGRGRWFITSAE